MVELLSYGDSGWGDEILAGLGVTVALALATLPLGLALGFLIALAKTGRDPALRAAAEIYTTVFRGLPELLTLFLIFYGLPLLLNAAQRLWTDSPDLQINSFVAGMVALGMVFSAYAAEVFQSAFHGIAKGQYEAGAALGLPRLRALRFIILPQLLRLALPGLANLWLILLKETALVSAIGLPDLLRQTGVAARVSKEAFLFFGVACLLYLALALLSSVAIGYIERRSLRGEAK